MRLKCQTHDNHRFFARRDNYVLWCWRIWVRFGVSAARYAAFITFLFLLMQNEDFSTNNRVRERGVCDSVSYFPCEGVIKLSLHTKSWEKPTSALKYFAHWYLRVSRYLLSSLLWAITLPSDWTVNDFERMFLKIPVRLWWSVFFRDVFVKKHRNIKPLPALKRIVLAELICFLQYTEKRFLGTCSRTDFSEEKYAGKLRELFTETGIRGTLKASNYEIIDLVSPLRAEIVDMLVELLAKLHPLKVLRCSPT